MKKVLGMDSSSSSGSQDQTQSQTLSSTDPTPGPNDSSDAFSKMVAADAAAVKPAADDDPIMKMRSV